MFKTNKKNNHYQYTQLLISITNTLYFDDCQNTKSSFLFTAFTVVQFTTVKAAMVAERNDQMQHLILFSVFHVSQKKEQLLGYTQLRCLHEIRKLGCLSFLHMWIVHIFRSFWTSLPLVDEIIIFKLCPVFFVWWYLFIDHSIWSETDFWWPSWSQLML